MWRAAPAPHRMYFCVRYGSVSNPNGWEREEKNTHATSRRVPKVELWNGRGADAATILFSFFFPGLETGYVNSEQVRKWLRYQ